jgi:hypothetical protein
MSTAGKPVSRSLVVAGARVTFALAAAVSLVLCFAAGIAEAHGGGPGLTYDPCMQQTGADDFIHLAVYQPDFNPFAEYCAAVPQAGRTLLVFDLMGAELPDEPVSLEVSEEGGHVRMSVPSRRYRSGVADLRADLPPGKYTVLVSIDEPRESRRLAFPLTVGAWWGRLVVPVVIILLIGLVTVGYCIFQIRGSTSDLADSATTSPIELRAVGKR